MIHNPNTIYTYYESGDQNSGGENTRDFEVDPTVIDSYIKAFGVMNDEAFDPIIEKRTFDMGLD